MRASDNERRSWFRRRSWAVLVCVALMSAVFAAGCGDDDDSGNSGSTEPAASADDGAAKDASSGKYATIFDEQMADLPTELEAQTVQVGDHSVKFDAGEPISVAVIGYGRGFTYSAPEYVAAETEGKKLGFKVDTFDPAGDVQKQINQLQDIMASGKYNAVVLYPLDANLECNLLTKQLPAANILVVAIGQPPCAGAETSPGLLSVIPDLGGTQGTFDKWAEYIAEDNPEDTNVLFLAGPTTDYVSQISLKAFEEMLADHPNLKLQQVLRGDYTPPGALKVTQDGLQKFPETDILVSMSPEGTQGALGAVAGAGLSDQVKVYDAGASQFIMDKIESGAVRVSIPYYPYTKTKAALQALAIARSGGEVPDFIENAGHLEEEMRHEGESLLFITKDNVAQFRQIAEY